MTKVFTESDRMEAASELSHRLALDLEFAEIKVVVEKTSPATSSPRPT